jgi:hypothetical protein
MRNKTPQCELKNVHPILLNFTEPIGDEAFTETSHNLLIPLITHYIRYRIQLLDWVSTMWRKHIGTMEVTFHEILTRSRWMISLMLRSLNSRYKLNRRLSALRSKCEDLAPAVANNLLIWPVRCMNTKRTPAAPAKVLFAGRSSGCVWSILLRNIGAGSFLRSYQLLSLPAVLTHDKEHLI